jgi:glycosyltransferase involved in cell wall biosynthesis
MRTSQQLEPVKGREVAPRLPLISVVMPVHNGLPYLNESIQSILNQTLEDFEFVILNDGSTDETGAALRDWQRKDRRIRVFESARNLGLAGSSNYVVEKARSPLIARMDADDVTHPERLKRQWEILEEHASVQLVGTLWEGIDARSRRIRPRDRWRLVRRSTFAPFPHGSVMFRRQAFDRIGGYREVCDFWEDLDLYLRMAATGQIAVIPDVLYQYRFHLNGSRTAFQTEQMENAVGLMRRCVSEYRAGRDYNALLLEREENGASQKLHPAVFTSIGSARLWAGHSPAVLNSLWRRGALACDRATALALVWAVWGALSPSSLRLLIRSLTRASDAIASRRLGNRRLHEWRFE